MLLLELIVDIHKDGKGNLTRGISLSCLSKTQKMAKKLTRSISLSCRYTDCLISLNNNRFKKFTADICLKLLTIFEITESISFA